MSMYEKVLNSEYKEFTNHLFDIIRTLDATPMTDEAKSLCMSAKKMLKTMMKSAEEQFTEYDTKYYKLGDITYYQNGLCVMDSDEELFVDLGTFSDTAEQINEQNDDKSIVQIDNNFNDLYLISETISAINDNHYKFKRVYNGFYITFERMIYTSKQIMKELEDPNNGQIDKLKESLKKRFDAAKNVIDKISSNNEICILPQKNIFAFKENQSTDLFDKITIMDVNEDNFVEIGEKIIDFLKQDDFNKDMCEKMKILERD